jgi:hypothetical protein
MSTAQPTPRRFTSGRGRSLGLRQAEKAVNSTGLDKSQAHLPFFDGAEEGWRLHEERVLARRSSCNYWRHSVCAEINVKSTRGVLLREYRGSARVSDSWSWAIDTNSTICIENASVY